MKILVADDSRYFQRLLEGILVGWDYEVVLASDGLQAWDMLKQHDGPRLAIVDLVMPQMNGLELCQKIRSSALSSYVYVIILTTLTGSENTVIGLEAGADDYIFKPFNEQELKSRLQIGERILDLENRIMQLALIDPLTGILNRRAFMSRLESEIQRSYRLKQPLSLIMVDIDNFKHVNDSYGHQVGDSVLVTLAEIMTACLRVYDCLGRFGGEEFILCIPGVDAELAGQIAERMRCRVEQDDLYHAGLEAPLKITVSLGVAQLQESIGEESNLLIKKADTMLYKAKQQGKNQVCIHDK